MVVADDLWPGRYHDICNQHADKQVSFKQSISNTPVLKTVQFSAQLQTIDIVQLNISHS